jgi:hypothetical protein
VPRQDDDPGARRWKTEIEAGGVSSDGAVARATLTLVPQNWRARKPRLQATGHAAPASGAS